MPESIRDKKVRLLLAAEKAVDELIEVLNDKIIGNSALSESEKSNLLSADKMKNAAAAKRLAFEDALFILENIEKERGKIEEGPIPVVTLGNKGFAEGRFKK